MVMNDVDRSWIKRYQRIAEELPVRRDLVTMLRYLQSNRVTGTQSLGNLPLKAVREITATFVNPPVLDRNIGERLYKLRSEDEVWPLVFLHVIAEVGDLLSGGRARLFRVTPQGDNFLGLTPLEQVKYMFFTWWVNVNWLIAYPYEGMGEQLPKQLHIIALESLLEVKNEKQVHFENFAEKLILDSDLSWNSEHRNSHHSHLLSSIEKMVIDVLRDFFILNVSYRKELKYKIEFNRLDAFQITDFGQDLLTMVYINI
jgi:hypothetical protein